LRNKERRLYHTHPCASLNENTPSTEKVTKIFTLSSRNYYQGVVAFLTLKMLV